MSRLMTTDDDPVVMCLVQ